MDHGKAARELGHQPRSLEESIKDIYTWFEQVGKIVMTSFAPQYRPVAMTIAGSDSGCGAGIQVDLRMFSARVYGATVLTALTAQSPLEVRAVQV